MTPERPLQIALVAGEASGDQLGAGLITAVRARLGDRVQFAGVAGPAMRSAGCEAWFDSDELAVMGLVEVLAHLPRLLALRRKLYRRIIAQQPDVFIGIDAPDFNLGLERRLRRTGIRTVHYVSPSVWAWRPKRAARMAQCADLVLCLLPFEPRFYEDYGVAAEFVGHPLADSIPLRPDRAAARAALELPGTGEVVALLPGSRASELDRLGAVFASAAARLDQSRPGIGFVAPMAAPALREKFAAQLAAHAPGVPVRLVDRQAQQAIAAADAVLVASGTATLEALLLKRPMVVAYRLAQGTRILLEKLKLLNIRRFALPNLLADREIVAEVLQDELTAERLSAELTALLDRDSHDDYLQECDQIHDVLRQSASERAADAVLRLTGRSS
ncbi:MAG: lipid-A-disaccharide synthase [Gammaproteobacteria bacterium]|nr:lipid-A-disaccharide synthase [Gammaproteobacteria bacterium]NNF59824.1 lipid-A-disaccharide synthase [Gammaproteobacteria bacterium]NNM21302.1 lipid-A-disaccharide synthase [Gammaproteobacteria bacterium]